MGRGWKHFERRIAADIGGRRRPVTGVDRGDGDVVTTMFEIQCKCRGRQPSYLLDWLRGIVATASARNKVGVVVWKEPGRKQLDDDALVVMRWRDFVDLHGDVRTDDAI